MNKTSFDSRYKIELPNSNNELPIAQPLVPNKQREQKHGHPVICLSPEIKSSKGTYFHKGQTGGGDFTNKVQ
jgi:hypothetical protein